MPIKSNFKIMNTIQKKCSIWSCMLYSTESKLDSIKIKALDYYYMMQVQRLNQELCSPFQRLH